MHSLISSKSTGILAIGLIFIFSIQKCSSAPPGPPDEEQCRKIVFKEVGSNCTKEEAGKTFPILGNCTAYFKCDYVVSLATTLPEPIQTCPPDQFFDLSQGLCTQELSKTVSCDQIIDCAQILDSDSENVGNNGSLSGKSGQYNFGSGPTTIQPPPHQHDPNEDNHDQGRANHDEHSTEVVQIPPTEKPGQHPDQHNDNAKDAKAQHGEHSSAHGLVASGFVSISSIVVAAITTFY